MRLVQFTATLFSLSRGCSKLSETSINMGGYNSNIGVDPSIPIQFFMFPNNTCPYAQRTHITLLELDIPFDLQTVRKGEDWYRKINPLGKVPALRLPSTDVVYESAICNEYLCDLALESDRHSLMPKNSLMKAKIRILNHYCDELGKAQFTFLMNKDSEKDKILIQDMEKALQVYEDSLRKEGGSYLMGEVFTMADVHVFPFIQRLIITLLFFKKYEIPSAKFPLLLNWFVLCSGRESIQQSSMNSDKTIEVYQGFVNANYDFGGLNTNK